MSHSKTYSGYCVKCRKSTTFKGEVKLTKNQRNIAQGPCPECGTTVNRILGKEAAAPN